MQAPHPGMVMRGPGEAGWGQAGGSLYREPDPQCLPGLAFEDGKCAQGLQNMYFSFWAANQKAWP